MQEVVKVLYMLKKQLLLPCVVQLQLHAVAWFVLVLDCLSLLVTP